MRRIGSLALAACMSATLAAVPVGLDLKDPSKLATLSAFAKNGNGGGNGGNGGGGNGGGSNKSDSGDKGGGKDKSGSKNASSRGKSETTHAKADTKEKKDPIANAFGKLFGKGEAKVAAVEKSKPARKAINPTATTAKLKKAPEEKPLSAKLGSLNSLNRNYHAYMNSQDPRMTAIRAYVLAYAQFELDNGVDAIPVDPALSDEALSAALVSASNKNINTAQPGEPTVVDPEVMDWAKDVLGVGPSVGKIDQVRDELATEQASEAETEQAAVVE